MSGALLFFFTKKTKNQKKKTPPTRTAVMGLMLPLTEMRTPASTTVSLCGTSSERVREAAAATGAAVSACGMNRVKATGKKRGLVLRKSTS
jgi:hypothetical protein